MTIQERLDAAKQRGSDLYNQRVSLEERRQKLQSEARALDIECVKLDGAVETLLALLKESGEHNG